VKVKNFIVFLELSMLELVPGVNLLDLGLNQEARGFGQPNLLLNM
tara:strand:+ start:247 stop:381 length:135 start_codon:yes stop_codon:yes gene_type:complete